ncbi:MAG: cysteine--tRNA ligase [Phycisphaerales bacterium]
MPLKLYNTLTKSLEPFTPQDPAHIRFYTCGPTVYDDAHIGNFRSFLAADLLRRWLESPLCTLTDSDGNDHQGPRQVTHVMNITDVGHMTDDDNADGAGEDKMDVAARRILEAKKSGTLPPDANVDPNNPFQIAQFYEARFKADAKALGMKVAIDADKDPSLMPRATGNIKEMKQVIEDLLEKGDAYPAGSPGSRAIYFNVQSFKRYGKLSGNTLDQLKGGAGGRVDESNQSEKKHPADFLLWKEDSTHKMKWPSPKVPGPNGQQDAWGDGYPGWHIECTAMALNRLIPGGLPAAKATHAHIDLHSGGEDNIFPHHECEIAQSCCFTGSDHFAAHWFHPRFLKVDGQKMSKSKGTMHTLRDLTAKGFDPAAIRLELIKTHYRANADFSIQGLNESTKRIERWRRMARQLHYAVENDSHAFIHNRMNSALEVVQKSMSNDLSMSECLSVLDQASRQHDSRGESGVHIPSADEISAYSIPTTPWEPSDAHEKLSSSIPSHRQLAALHLIDNILGVIFRPVEKAQDTGIALYQPGVTPSDEIESLLQQRADAKKSKDFAAADAIRDQLTALGLSIMDKPGGKVEVAIAN